MISLCSFREEEDSLTAKKVGYSMESENIYGCEMQEDRMKKLIKNGTIVLEDKVIQGDLLIEDEVIAEIGQNLDAEGGQIIDATGLVVLPGGIDVHKIGRASCRERV